MNALASWEEQGTQFGLECRPAYSGDDEAHFRDNRTWQAFRSLCFQNHISLSEEDSEAAFQVFHLAACRAYFPPVEENTGVEELLQWFPFRHFFGGSVMDHSVRFTFGAAEDYEEAEDYVLSVEMERTEAAFLLKWDLERRVVHETALGGKQDQMERRGQRIYDVETYEQALSLLARLVETADFSHSLFPQKFFVSPGLAFSANTLKAPPVQLRKLRLPKRFQRGMVLNTEEEMEIIDDGSISFQVEVNNTFLHATAGGICDTRVAPDQPIVTYYWEWKEKKWSESYGWLEDERDVIKNVNCPQEQLQETFYQALLLMFDGVRVESDGFYRALFQRGVSLEA